MNSLQWVIKYASISIVLFFMLKKNRASNRGRKPEQSQILTSSPYKNQLFEKKKAKEAVKKTQKRTKKRASKTNDENEPETSRNVKKAPPKKPRTTLNKKLFQENDSSSSEEDLEWCSELDDSSSTGEFDTDDENPECLYCNGRFLEDRGGEKWLKCTNKKCGIWLHVGETGARSLRDEEKKQELLAALQIHKKRTKAFSDFLRPPPPEEDGSEILDDRLILSFDCEKNLQLLRVPDSAAYYSRNVYLYNFTVVQGYSKSSLSPDNVTSFCWTENEFIKNANAIASCVIHQLNSIDLKFYNRIRLVADGCPGQNKNSIMVGGLLHWFSTQAPAHIVEIELVFPITGHSFIPPDRVFAQIEKKIRRKDAISNPDDYLKIIKEIAMVKKLGTNVKVLEIKDGIKNVMKPCSAWNFSISTMKRIIFRRKPYSPEVIEMKGEPFYCHNVGVFSSACCKRSKSLKNLTFNEIEAGNEISKEKKKDILALLEKHYGTEWRIRPELCFFVELLDMAIIIGDGEAGNSDVDEPACVHCDKNPKLIV